MNIGTTLGNLFRPAATREVLGSLQQLVAEPWAMEPARLEQLVAGLAARVQASNHLEHAAAQSARYGRASEEDLGPGYLLRDGIAVIPVCGLILKSVPSWFSWYEVSATSTVRTQAALATARDDTKVRGVLLAIESPGGTVSGVQELADAVYGARGRKPIAAHVSDLCASAAYWVGCQADKVTANETALVGSIGVYRVVQDWSRFFETAGVRTHVVTSHPLKGAGVFGAPVTDAQRADMQREIDAFADRFVAAVMRGRGMTEEAARAVATGQCWLAAEAQALGLIDGVATLEVAVSDACPNPGDDEDDIPPAPPARGSAETTEETPPGGDGDSMQNKATTTPAGDTTPPAAAAEAQELARLRAENELLKDTARRQADARKSDVVAKHEAAGRIVPAQQDLVARLSASYGDDVEGFDKALGALPVQVRSTPQGGGQGDQRVAGGGVTRDDSRQAAAEAAVARALGTSTASMEASEQIDTIDPFTRKAAMKDGSQRDIAKLYQ